MLFVTKADGRRQPFQKEKVIRTCLRIGSSVEVAEKIAERIEREAYNGIPTKKILKLIFSHLREYYPQIGYRQDLREAISLLRSKPDFEEFVRKVLADYGYEVSPNQLIEGKCVEHEIDGIAKKDGETILLEVKHHLQYHTYTSMDVFLKVWATFLDLKEGYKLGKNKINFTKILIVCNTKISEHARRYADCMGIEHIGWKYPREKGLERMIEEKKLYPITLLKKLKVRERERFGDSGIVLLKQLVEMDLKDISSKTRIPIKRLIILKKDAEELLKMEAKWDYS